MGWLLAFRLEHRAIGLVSMLVLPRLLTPEDFRLAALAGSLVAAGAISAAGVVASTTPRAKSGIGAGSIRDHP